jgi:phosphatidylserine/phosphatidylglycerophosphate/cardiolipin synthase-like enzyme
VIAAVRSAAKADHRKTPVISLYPRRRRSGDREFHQRRAAAGRLPDVNACGAGSDGGHVGDAVHIHRKVMVIDPFGDRPVVIAGSRNLGNKASPANDDNIMIVRSLFRRRSSRSAPLNKTSTKPVVYGERFVKRRGIFSLKWHRVTVSSQVA